MATSNSIPAHTADQIFGRLNFVAMILRSMRDLVGDMGLGNYNDHEWDTEDEPEEGGAA